MMIYGLHGNFGGVWWGKQQLNLECQAPKQVEVPQESILSKAPLFSRQPLDSELACPTKHELPGGEFYQSCVDYQRNFQVQTLTFD